MLKFTDFLFPSLFLSIFCSSALVSAKVYLSFFFSFSKIITKEKKNIKWEVKEYVKIEEI